MTPVLMREHAKSGSLLVADVAMRACQFAQVPPHQPTAASWGRHSPLPSLITEHATISC